MPDEQSTALRLERIEVLLSHLQHDVDKLNDALTSQQGEIDRLRRSLEKLEAAVEQIPSPPRDPLEERPPHY